MKIVVPKAHLQESLQVAERIAAKSPSLPILENVLVSAQKDAVKLSATDLQIGVVCSFLGSVEKEGATVFPAKLLLPLLQVFHEDEVHLETKGQTLVVRSGTYHTTIKTLDAEEFPIIPTSKGGDPFIQIPLDVLCEGLGRVVGVTGQSQARPEIAGVFFNVEKGRVVLVATDSFRLAEMSIKLGEGSGVEQSFIVPQKTAREVITTLSEKQGAVRVSFSLNQATFDYSPQGDPSQLHVRTVSRLIEGEYPHYQDVIPGKYETVVETSKASLVSHIRAASVFSGKTNEIHVVADPQKKGVEFFSESVEVGESKSFLSSVVKGKHTEASFNWRFLYEGLVHIKRDEVELALNGTEGPAAVRAREADGYLYVIMPIKA